MRRVSIWDELQRAWAITVKDMRIYYLRPPSIMFGILFPLTLFLSFTVGRNIPPDRIVPILASQTVFWASSSIGPVAIPMERRLKTFDRYLSAPISLIAILLGKILAGVIYGLAVSSLSLIIGILIYRVSSINIPIIILGLGISSLGFSALGIMFASIPWENPGEVMMPLNFFRIPLLFISGLYIPLESLPMPGQVAALLSPLTHTLDLLKYGLGEKSFFGIITNISMLFIFTTLFIFVSAAFHRKTMKKE
jgi:ABC-2 type transport system permease protein